MVLPFPYGNVMGTWVKARACTSQYLSFAPVGVEDVFMAKIRTGALSAPPEVLSPEMR